MGQNRVPLYTEISSFHGVGIEFHNKQRCLHFRGLEYSSTEYRGVLISGCWNRGVPLYTEVSSFQGVGMEFHCIQRCPQVGVKGFQRCPHFFWVIYSGILL